MTTLEAARAASATLKTRASLIEQARADWNPALVGINSKAMARLGVEFDSRLPSFSYLGHDDWSLTERAAYWIYCSAQAFQFWRLDPTDRTVRRYHYRNASGSTAMFIRILDCWEDGCVPGHRIDTAFSNAPCSGIRQAIGKELSGQYLTLYACADLIIEAARAGRLSMAHAGLLADTFPMAFSDPYLKKAQLAVTAIGGLVQDIHGVAIDCDLTAFADYQVPRVLRALGVLEYSPDLSRLIEQRSLLVPGGDYERAIRGATILAVEQLAECFGTQPVIVDNLLWRSQSIAAGVNFHLTQTDHY